MVIRLVAIKPRRAAMADGKTVITELDRRLRLTGFAGEMIRKMANYPPQQPTTYRRSGRLGRNWKMSSTRSRGSDRAVEVTNRTDYAVHVEGPRRGLVGARQTREMRKRNWPAVDVQVRKVWERTEPGIVRILTGKDSRVSRARSRRRRF